MSKQITTFICIVTIGVITIGLFNCGGESETHEPLTIPDMVVGTFAFSDESGKIVLNFTENSTLYQPTNFQITTVHSITRFLKIGSDEIPVTGTVDTEYPYRISLTAVGAVSGVDSTYSYTDYYTQTQDTTHFFINIQRTREGVTVGGCLFGIQVETSTEEPDVYAGYFGEWHEFTEATPYNLPEKEWLMYNNGSIWVIDDSISGSVTFYPSGVIDIDGTFNMAVPVDDEGVVIGTWAVNDGSDNPDRGYITGEKTGTSSFNITKVLYRGGTPDDYTTNPITAQIYNAGNGIIDTGESCTEGFWDDIDDGTDMCFYALLIPSDTDGDGIPDSWEYNHGLDLDDPSDAEEDPDGDGWSNYEEYINGTDMYTADPHPQP